MSKELEALESMKNRLIDAKFTIEETTLYSKNRDLDEDYKLLKQALQRLEAIDNANPSEALESLKDLRDYLIRDRVNISSTKNYKVIEQALLKAQEQEKVLEILKNKDVDVYTLTALIENKGDNALKMYNDDFYIDSYRRLTQEEFNLLKRY